MKSSKYISILCVGSLLSLASCTDGFESDNKINGSFDDTVKEYDFQKYTTNFETIQKGIYFNYDWGEGTTWPWQTFQNLNHDMFSGYFHDFASKFSDKNTVYALEAEGGNLAASKIRNLECPSYEICLIDYGCGKFNRKIHIMEQYP